MSNVLDDIRNEGIKASVPQHEEPVVEVPKEEVLEEQTTEQTNQQENLIDNEKEVIKTTEPVSPIEEREVKVVGNFANEELAEANAYLLKNPSKSYEDFKALKIPTSEIKDEDLMKMYLSEKEGKSELSVAYEVKRLELSDSEDGLDEDFITEEESLNLLKKKADREELIRKAREWREDLVKSELTFESQIEEKQEETQQPVKSIEDFINDAKVAHDEFKENHRVKVYEAAAEINQIELNIKGNSVKFVPDENFRMQMIKSAEDVGSIGSEFFDDKGSLTNAKSFIQENTLWADPKTRQPMLDFVIEQAILNDRASRDKVERNITLGNMGSASMEGQLDRSSLVEKRLREGSSRTF